MSTINELMEGKQPGEIKMKRSHWGDDDGSWFRPYYYIEHKNEWYGITNHSRSTSWIAAYHGWEIYKEPVKIVTWYRPKTVLGSSGPQETGATWWSKDKLAVFVSCKVIEWEERQWPEDIMEKEDES